MNVGEISEKEETDNMEILMNCVAFLKKEVEYRKVELEEKNKLITSLEKNYKIFSKLVLMETRSNVSEDATSPQSNKNYQDNNTVLK